MNQFITLSGILLTMNYILAIDQGTSSTRVIIFNSEGEQVDIRQYPVTQFYPKTGWVEHDPEEIWQQTQKAIKEVTENLPAKSVLCCGITNQRETTVVWDKRSGQCLTPAIVWQDRRTEDFCSSIANEKHSIRQKTGLLLDPYFSATKLRWILQHCPEASNLAKKGLLAFGTIDSFLIWRLTGGKSHLTDVTNASRTMLYNIRDEAWDEELLQLFQVPPAVLPEVCSSDAHFGFIQKEILGYEVPITGVAGDQQSALIGQCCFAEGMIKATFGTGGFLLMNTGSRIVDSEHLLSTIAYNLKNQTVYGLEGSIYHAGTTIKWLRDELKLIATADESEELAKSLSSNEGVYFISSFTGLGAPYWTSKQSANIVGLSRLSARAHFARAALEGVCYQVRDVLQCMQHASNIDMSLLRVDGGMSANNWFLQFLANQCDLLVQRPVNIETTAYGTAILATLGLGVFADLEQLKTMWQLGTEFRRNEERQISERNYEGWQRALKTVLEDIHSL